MTLGPGQRAVLVTGGAGYIGSHVCKAIAARGWLPVAYDDLSTGNEWALRFGPFERGDLLDSGRLAAVLRRHRVTAVAHLAARCVVADGERDPAGYRRVNTDGTASLIAAMREAGVGTLVHSSTCAVYGQPDSAPVGEDAPLAPVSVYGRSKLAAENLIVAARDDGLRAVRLRYFNVAGADPDGTLGEWHVPETRLVPRILTALRDAAPVEINGTDYPTADGTCVRDYLHVADVAGAHLAALDALFAGFDGGVFNLGSGRGFSVLEVLAACERELGRRATRALRPRRHGDPAALFADPQRATAELGWRPRHGDLATIVHTAWRWIRDGAAIRALRSLEPGQAL